MQHINLKLFARTPAPEDIAPAIPMFHRWIQTSALPELLIDVADYAHVPAGPGVLVIGHEANYGLDLTSNRLGLLYNRKAVLDGSDLDTLRHAWDRVQTAAKLISESPEFTGKLQFKDDELEIILNDRLLYPNKPETWEQVRPAVDTFLAELWPGAQWEVTHASDPRERFTAQIRRTA